MTEAILTWENTDFGLKTTDGRFTIVVGDNAPPSVLYDHAWMVGHYMEIKNAKAEAELRARS